MYMHSNGPTTTASPAPGGADAGVPRGAAGRREPGLAQPSGPPRRGQLARARRPRDLLDPARSGSAHPDAGGRRPGRRRACGDDRTERRGRRRRRVRRAIRGPGVVRRLARRARLCRQPAPARRSGRPPPAGDRPGARGRAARSRRAGAADRPGSRRLGRRTGAAPKAERIDCVKPATRQQLLRRILLAADFITSRHDEPISLDEMARAASLSRFHFVRLFSLVHGETPHAFLRRKRTAVARRHLAVGSACSEAASRAGFGSRSSLFRNLRKSAPADAGSEPCFPSA